MISMISLFCFLIVLYPECSYASSTDSNSGDSSDSTNGCASGVTKCASFDGDLSHGANIRYGECISTWDNENLQLSQSGLDFWKSFCIKEVSLLSGNDIVQGLDESNEFMAQYLTDDMANTDFRGNRDYWNNILSSDEQEFQPILDNPSIYISPSIDTSDTCSIRGFLPGASDVLSGNHPKYQAYRGYSIENQGIYTLEQWNKAKGFITLDCYSNGQGRIKIDFENLIPYIPYTLWGVYGISDYPSESQPFPIAASPVAGVPSAFYTDNNGDASVDYIVPFCPLDTYDPLMYIAALAHWDFVVSGAFFTADRPTSIGGGDQVVFSVGDYVY